jgi:hypothetical protein
MKLRRSYSAWISGPTLELIDLMLVSAFSNACRSFFSNKLMLQASKQAGKGKKASQTTE